MQEMLSCPLCGHLHLKPNHHSNFKCKGCEQLIELPYGENHLRDYRARKAEEQARKNRHWEGLALQKMKKEGLDFDTALNMVLGTHLKNVQKMKDEACVKKLFPPEPQAEVAISFSGDNSDPPWD